MDKRLNLLAAILIFVSLVMGQSVITVTESHAHDQEFEHSNIQENHNHHNNSVSLENSGIKKSTKSKNPVHEHSTLKINSLKVIGRTYFRYSIPHQAVNISISFMFAGTTFDSVSPVANLRPPIFS